VWLPAAYRQPATSILCIVIAVATWFYVGSWITGIGALFIAGFCIELVAWILLALGLDRRVPADKAESPRDRTTT